MTKLTSIQEPKQHTDIERIIFRMPPLSTTVNKLLEICNDPKTSPSQLVQVISLDPVLTGKVINLINSVYYSLPGKVSSLNRSIILLGVNTVINLALSTAILEKFSSSGSFASFPMDAFWAHSIGVGVTAKAIATALDIPRQEREAYFVAGLLHDLGKIPLSIGYPDAYARIFSPTGSSKISSTFLENRVLGIDHCAVGGMIAEKWRLGAALSDILRHHHDPDATQEKNRLMTGIVALGDIYAREILGGSAQSDDLKNQSLNTLLEKVGISWSLLADHREIILEEIEKAQIFLQVSTRG